MDAIRVAKVEGVLLDKYGKRSEGVLHVTPHHLIFTTSAGEEWVPYPHITVLHRLPQTHSGLSPVYIRTRMFETLVLSFKRERDAEDIWFSVKDLCLVSSLDQLHAFHYRLEPPSTLLKPVSTQLPTSTDQQHISPVPLSSEANLEAFSSGMSSPRNTEAADNGWNIYSPREEFARMGVGSRNKAWRFTDINKDYVISPTYPAKMVVPAKISDTVIAYACKYRSKGRIPALAYLHWANHASITRCSQPLVGLKNNRSNQDERLIEAIFTSHTSPETAYGPPPSEYGAGFGSGNPLIASSSSASMQAISTSSSAQTVYGATATNLIVDARPTANAMANVATGAGTENMEYYKLARKTYLGIENIHVMRDSLKKIETALQKAENTGMMDRHLLRRSNWLKHISAILDGALIIVRNVHINSSHVLIHCSDGWDRTSQLSALAQVCLDPYFRTIKGFQVLIEKDWISFGHKFMDRCGHLSPDKLDSNSASKAEEEDEERNEATKAAQAIFGAFQKQFTPSSHHVKETSPVFHQFLDCVQQLQRQFPERFEYNSKFLEDLYYHLYSCQFGTFISNTERQRRTRGGIDDDGASLITASKPPLCERTVSIWNHFNLPSQLKKYTNSRYDTSLDDRTLNSTDGDMGVLLPNAKDVRFWSELFKRGDEEMNGAKQLIFDQAQGVEVFGPISTSAGDPVVERDPATARQANAILDSFADATNPIGGPRSPGRSSSPLPRSASPAYKASGDSWHNVEASSIPGPVARKKVETTSLGYGYPASQSPNRAKSGGGSWGWSNFSSGALSALQGAAKEIRTIGADAYTNLGGPASDRSTGDASTAWDRPASSSVRTADYPTSGGWSNNYSAPPKARVVSDANPWASSSLNESSLANDTIHKETQGLSQAARVPAPPIHSDNSYLKTPSETWGSVADRKHRGATPQDNRAVADLSDGINGLAVNTPTRSVDPVSNSNSNGKPSSWDPLGAM